MNTEQIAISMLNRASKQVAQNRFIQKQRNKTNAILSDIQAEVDSVYYSTQSVVDYCSVPMNLTKQEIMIESKVSQKLWGTSC